MHTEELTSKITLTEDNSIQLNSVQTPEGKKTLLGFEPD